MRYKSVAFVILSSCLITEAIREELNIADINPQGIQSQALLTSGVHLGDFPLPSYLKERQFFNPIHSCFHRDCCSGLLAGQWPVWRGQEAGHDPRWAGLARGGGILVPERNQCLAGRPKFPLNTGPKGKLVITLTYVCRSIFVGRKKIQL